MADVAEKERKIMVAVDEGEESLYALTWCLKNMILENSKDTLILVYAKPPRAVYSAIDGSGTIRESRQGYMFSSDIMATTEKYSSDVAQCVTVEKYSNDVAQCVIDKAKKVCKNIKDVKVESRVELGDARDVICELAEKLGIDLVVLGSHGYGVIKRAFLGSVSNHCAQNIKRPVLIVKKPKGAATTSTN